MARPHFTPQLQVASQLWLIKTQRQTVYLNRIKHFLGWACPLSPAVPALFLSSPGGFKKLYIFHAYCSVSDSGDSAVSQAQTHTIMGFCLETWG